MKLKHVAVGIAAAALVAGLTGCSSGQSNSGGMAATDSLNAPPARQRGLMVAGDSLGRAVFSENHPALANVPDRDR